MEIRSDRRGAVAVVSIDGSIDGTTAADLVAALRGQVGDLRLAAVRREVLRVLELSGFTSILQVYPDVDSAAASYPASA